MKGVIYARYSSDNQREESIEGQIRECTTFAEKNGITVLTSYIDRAYSARTDNRPDFQRMIRDSEKRLFDIIIVWKLDRFARDRYDSAHYKRQLKKNGVKVISATEIISDSSEGILMESVLEGMAEYYSRELSEKVTRGMTENALKHRYNGGALPFGYTINKEQQFEPNPIEAPIVLEIFTQYANGDNMQAILNKLNGKGIHRSNGRKFSLDAISRMLNNRRYIGEYKFKDMVFPDGIPAIVPIELFEKVQERLAKTRKAPARHKAEDDYLLSTKLFCGSCGAMMFGESGTSRTGTVHHYYKCAAAKKKKTCSKKAVKKLWIEDIIIEQCMGYINNDAAIEKIADKVMVYQRKENTTLPSLKKQLDSVNRSISNILNAIEQGIFTPSTKERLEELERTKEELSVKIMQEEIERTFLTREQVITWLQRFRSIDTNIKDHRQLLIDMFVNAVYLYDDKLVITFNYKDEAGTVSKQEVEAVFGSDISALGAPFRVFITYLSGTI